MTVLVLWVEETPITCIVLLSQFVISLQQLQYFLFPFFHWCQVWQDSCSKIKESNTTTNDNFCTHHFIIWAQLERCLISWVIHGQSLISISGLSFFLIAFRCVVLPKIWTKMLWTLFLYNLNLRYKNPISSQNIVCGSRMHYLQAPFH